jgi:hypothetical protein
MRLPRLASSLVLIALLSASCRFAGGFSQSPTGISQASDGAAVSFPANPSPSASAHPDAAAYARDFGVSVEEATRRLNIQAELHPLRSSLASAIGNRWAGGWLEHEPEFRFVVRVTGQDVAEFEAMTADWPLPVHFITGAEFTESEALDGLERINDRLFEAFPSLGMGWYPQAGEIVISGPDEPSAEFLAELEELAGVPVRYEYSKGFELLGG